MMSPFYRVIEAAIADIEANGYDSQSRIDMWIKRIEQSAAESAAPAHAVQEALNRTMRTIYTRLIERGGYAQIHQGVSRFTVDQLKPKLQRELERRIVASSELIRLNRKQMIAQTVQRFTGWSTSIPPGGSHAVDKADVKKDLKKSFSQLTFEERRVMIDQGHKLAATINNIIAVDGGAIAVIWKSHWRQPGYHYRQDHKERDGRVYMIRDSWAFMQGLVKRGANGYYDEITAVGEEVFCRCAAQYIYNLRDLPDDALTIKGRDSLAIART